MNFMPCPIARSALSAQFWTRRTQAFLETISIVQKAAHGLGLPRQSAPRTPSAAPSYLQSPRSRRRRRRPRAPGRSCRGRARPARGRPGSGGSVRPRTPARTKGTCGGQRGERSPTARGRSGDGAGTARGPDLLPVLEPHHGVRTERRKKAGVGSNRRRALSISMLRLPRRA